MEDHAVTDLEITRLCATAMGYTSISTNHGGLPLFTHEAGIYDPLHDKAQAMELVERFDLCLEPNSPHVAKWAVWPMNDREREYITHNHNLCRAIVECVAKMEAAK